MLPSTGRRSGEPDGVPAEHLDGGETGDVRGIGRPLGVVWVVPAEPSVRRRFTGSRFIRRGAGGSLVTVGSAVDGTPIGTGRRTGPPASRWLGPQRRAADGSGQRQATAEAQHLTASYPRLALGIHRSSSGAAGYWGAAG